MSNPIFIARQDTLEQEILPAHWLSQYKLFGEESYTFQDKEIWKKLCMSSAAANDRDMHAEALEEMLTTFSAEHTGKWMLTVYGMDAAVLEGLASMAAVAGNGTAMAAVAANALLMHAITNSETAMRAIANSQTAMHAIANSETAMTAVAASSTAMTAVAASATAMGKIAAVDAALSKLAASTTAMDALYARKKQMKGGSASKSGKFIILEISQSNAFNTSKYGYATLSDGSKPDWSSYLAKYAFFQKYPKYATYMLNDTDSDDYIYYFDIASP